MLKKYDEFVEKGLKFYAEKEKLSGRKKHKGENLLIRLRDFKNEITGFLKCAKEPFTNNQAERDLRMIKTKQKVSGCFRTRHGGEYFLMIRSVLSFTKTKEKCYFEKNHYRRSCVCFFIKTPIFLGGVVVTIFF